MSPRGLVPAAAGSFPPDGVTWHDLMPSPLPSDPTRLLVASDTHGHWHQFQQVRLPGLDTEVIGLSTDGTLKSWIVLDLPGLEITHAPADAMSFG